MQIVKANFLVTFFVFMTLFATTRGTCSRIYVSGANYNYYVNGYYYYTYSSCAGHTVWMREMDIYPITTYVSYNSIFNGWVIRTYDCYNGNVLAQHPNSVGYSEPFDLPGYWLEWNPYNNGFEIDYNLRIVCASFDDESLNGWEIFGIVIGCICGAVFIFVLIAAICHCNKKKKLRHGNNATRTQQQAGVVSYSNAPVNGMTVTTISGQTVDIGTYYPSPNPARVSSPPYPATDPTYSTIPQDFVHPPVYDNQPPPAYAIVQSYPINVPSQGNAYVPS